MKLLHTVKAHDNQLVSMEVIMEGNHVSRVFTGSHDATIKMWGSKFQLLHTFQGHKTAVRAIVIYEQIYQVD